MLLRRVGVSVGVSVNHAESVPSVMVKSNLEPTGCQPLPSRMVAEIDEVCAWRGLAISLLQALTETRDGRAADAERHRAEQSGQQASFERRIVQDREDFLGIDAHELKTPVAVIKAYAELRGADGG
jgi:signal transduction histidine kinase